jgi:teichuronic acid exporter
MRASEIGLKQKVINSFMWLSSTTFLGQAATWVITLVVIRLLKPEDYGLMSMAAVFIGFLTIVNQIGLGPAVIQKADLAEQDLRNANGWVLVINIVLFIALFFCAPAIAWFFNEPRLTSITRVLGLSFILISLYFLPQSLMAREMNFKTRSLIELGANLCSGVVVLGLAWDGFGVWALVLGTLCSHLVKAVAYNTYKVYRHKPAFSLEGMRSMLVFGGYVSISRIIWYFYSQADILICGKIFGKDILGLYAVSMQLVSIPMNKISPMLSQVGFSAFSRVQTELAIVQKYYLEAVHLISLLAFPLFWGSAVIAPEAIPWLLGAKWTSAIVPIQLLSLVMPIRFIGTIYGPVLAGRGRPDVSMWNMIAAMIIMPVAFFIGAHWGIRGVCLAWVIAYPLIFVFMTYRVLNTLKIPAVKFLQAFWLPIAASFPMALGVLAIKSHIPLPIAITVPVVILLGIVFYAATILLINRNELNQIKALLSAKSG